MGYSMEDFPSASCAPSLDCNTCVQYSFCVILVLLNGSKVCASTAELRDDKYAFETMLFSSEDCVSHLNPQKPVPGSTADDPGFQTSCEESQKLIPSLMEEQIENSIEDVDLKAQVPGPQTETLVSPANDPGSMKEPPDSPKTIQNSAKVIPESPDAVQNPTKAIPETIEKLVPDSPLKIENLEKHCQSKSKVILPLKTVRDGLLENYSATSRPPKQPGEALIIQMNLFLHSLTVNVADSKFKTNGVLKLEWTDTRLSFPEIIEIESEMPDQDVQYEFHEIWQPEFTFDNGTKDVTLQRHLLHSNNHGLVLMEYIFNFTSDCHLSMLHWPYESHTCVVTATMNSFTDKNPAQLHFLKKVFKEETVDNLILENYNPNPVWKLKYASVKREIITCEEWNCSEHSIKVDFIFRIARNYNYITVTHHCILYYLVVTTSWMLKTQAFTIRKARLTGYNLSVLAIILFIISQSVPFIITRITIHGLLLILNAIAILYSLVFVHYIRKVYNVRPPANLRRHICDPVAVIIQGNVPAEIGIELLAEALLVVANGEWDQIAKFFDQKLFLTFIALYVVLDPFRCFYPLIF